MTTERSPRPLSGSLISVMALAVGLIVANLYYLQPLLHQLTGDFHISAANASLLMTLVQLGYALGLAFVVPLGDLIARRRLVVTIFVLSALSMVAGALVSSFALFCALTTLIGLFSVGGQVIIPFAADLADPAQRGRVIARVMTGLLLGILLSRTVAGLLAQVAGWRAVYWFAAGLLGVMAVVLARVLPDEAAREHVPYPTLVAGAFVLLATNRVLRRRAWFGALIFMAFNVVWTTLSFHLSAAPFHYSKAVVGLFGLFGLAGVLAANLAGHHADKQRSHVATLVGATLVTASFVLFMLGRGSFWAIAIGLVVLDAGMQGTQITNQSVIYALLPEARSRVNSAYMVCCFTGASIGSEVAGQVYDHVGWVGDCWVGVAIGVGLLVPALRGRRAPREAARAA